MGESWEQELIVSINWLSIVSIDKIDWSYCVDQLTVDRNDR